MAFSGHGVQFGKKAYLCPADTMLDRPESLVSLDWVYEQLKGCPASMKLVIVDACRDDPSVGGSRSFSKEARGFGQRLNTPPPEGIVLLSSCSPSEQAQEDAAFRLGVFTHFLLDGLAGKADRDGDHQISLNELFRHVSRETKLYVAHKFNASQRPYLRGETTLEMLDFPLAEVLKPKPSLAVAPFDETAARRFQQPWADYLGQPVETTNSIGMRLRLIPPGEFLMGSPENEENRYSNEGPQHRVRITKPFYLGVYEVTQAEYERVMGTHPSYFSKMGSHRDRVSGLDTSRFPVEDVSWEDAQEFCRRLSVKEGKTYRLPTEAEWEYACRAGTTTPFHFGSQLNGKQANCDGMVPYGTSIRGPYLARPTTVGSYAANAFGVFDMHGNLWKWCQDWYNEDYYAHSPTDDPRGPSSGSFRLFRGGGWFIIARYCRSAGRGRGSPEYGDDYLGFRLACSPVR